MYLLCDAYFKILKSNKFGEVFNVGSGENISIIDLYLRYLVIKY